MKKLQAVIQHNRAIVIVLILSLLFALSIPFLSNKTVYIPIDHIVVSVTPTPTSSSGEKEK